MIDLSRLAAAGTPEELEARRLDLGALPRHVAVIMDGNGRWAQARHLPRTEGHRAGVDAVRDTVEAAAQLELEVLTLYAFSTENWKRPRYEVWTLMNLLKEYLRRELDSLVENNISFRAIGRWRELDPSVQKAIEHGQRATAHCTGLQLNIALNYSGRAEIVDACRRIVAEFAAGNRVEIDEESLAEQLSTAGQPDPDLLIRTSGERRVSNFLLWQLAYTELFVTPVLWPDFRRRCLFEAIVDYQQRERRFGAIRTEADTGGSSESAADSTSSGALARL